MWSLENEDVIELEMNHSLRKRRRCENVVDMVDQDYIDFLEMLKTNVDSYVQSGEYCLDHSPRAAENVANNDIVDPDYKVFLENVKEDGYSYVLELENEDGIKVVLKYEAKDEDTTTKDEKFYEGPEKDDNVDRRYNNGKDEEGSLELEPKIEQLDDGYENVSACPVRKPDAATKLLSNCDPGEFSCADESYLMFLDHLWVQGDCLIYKNGDVVVRYGDNDDNVRDVSEDDSDSVQILDDEGYDENKFTTKLRTILRKPFNKKELKDKLQAAKDRKPVKKLRVMRTTDKWVATDQLGDSYLDQHYDLSNLVNRALSKRVPQRALSLLRCLFFYYENMPHQGSFKPWDNPPTWLHNMICSCQEDDIRCPMKYDGSRD